MHAPSPIKRRLSRQIHVGNVAVGGDAPISVQSMTNTNTLDVDATVGQIQQSRHFDGVEIKHRQEVSPREREGPAKDLVQTGGHGCH